MNALIIALPAAIIGGLLALAGVVLGSRITAKAMGGWFSPEPQAADQPDESDGSSIDSIHVPVIQSVRDKDRCEGVLGFLGGAGIKESYPAGTVVEPAPEFIIPPPEEEE